MVPTLECSPPAPSTDGDAVVDRLLPLLLAHRQQSTASSWLAVQSAVDAAAADPVARGELWDALFERLQGHLVSTAC